MSTELRRASEAPNLSSLFTKSPKPGVSTTVSFRRTPFSSMSKKNGHCQIMVFDAGSGYLPALMLSMATVLGRSAAGSSGVF
jgi:hypothetical protein